MKISAFTGVLLVLSMVVHAQSEYNRQAVQNVSFTLRPMWTRQNIPLGLKLERAVRDPDGSTLYHSVYVMPLGPEKPTNAAAFAKKLLTKDFDQFGMVWTEAKVQAVKNGFVVRGSMVFYKKSKQREVFRAATAVLNVSSGWIECSALDAPRAVTEEAIGICLSAK
jgi:hypothetical protein